MVIGMCARFLASQTSFEFGFEDQETGEMITLIRYNESGETIDHDGIRKIHHLLNQLDFDNEFLKEVIEAFKKGGSK